MAQIIHNISSPNDGLGDKLRVAFDHQNAMNTEIYDGKVDKLDGYGLSENNLTDAYVNILENLGTPYIPTLQEVLDNNHDLLNDNNFQGTNAGQNQTGSHVNAFGSSAGRNNEFSHVNLFGKGASADADNQTVFSKDGSVMARISYNDITDDRKYELPDKSGTFALLSDTSKSEYKTASFTAENNVFYTIQGSSLTVTDPTTQITGFGFIVYILSGLSNNIGSESYSVGSLVYRFWNGFTWVNKDISSMSEFTNIFNTLPTKLTKSGDTLTGDIQNISTGFFQVAQGTTAQRPSSPVNGMLRYNTTTQRNEFYSNGAWRNHAKLEGDTFTGAISATNLSGTNTGDQDLSTLVVKNTAITGATKTKITYDAKGLVTAGADATTADIADSTNKRYVTDAQLTLVNNAVKIVVKDAVQGSTITGVTTETLCGTYLIPANTFSANDIMKIMAFTAEKTGTAGTVTFRVKVGSTNVFSSATTIATYIISGTNLSATVLRNSLTLRGGNIRALSPTSSILSDIQATNSGFNNVAFNPAVDNYIFTSLQLSVGTDSVFQSNFNVTN